MVNIASFLYIKEWTLLAMTPLAACRCTRPCLLDEISRHPLCNGLDDYSDDDDDDGADTSTPLAAPPIPSL
jgi:hypothetical protein